MTLLETWQRGQDMTTITTTGAELALPDRAADQNPALVYLAALGSESGRLTMRAALKTIAGMIGGDWLTMPWHLLRYQHTAAIRAQLAERYAPATVNKHLAALRGVMRAALRLGQMTADDYQAATDLRPVRGETLLRGRALSSGELRALFGACAADHTPAGARDAGLLAVLYAAGLRRAEAAALDLADYDPDSGALTVRHGKGGKQRLTYLGNGGKAALGAWLAIRGPWAGPLFWPVNKSGSVTPRSMTPQAIYKRLQVRAEEAGVASFSPHDLRRTFIGDLLDAGADLATAQQLAGHANVTTTARYDRRGEATKQRAAGLVHVPWQG